MDPHLEVALSGAIPALLAMWLVDRLDAKRPEPLRLRWGVTLVGMLVTIPAIVIEQLLIRHVGIGLAPSFTYRSASFNSFIVAAAVEEACKIFAVYWVVWRRPEFDERMDGIVYAARAGLGFALVENILYLLQAPDMNGQIIMFIERALLAVPGHAMWTGMIGAAAARRRFDRRGLGLLGGYLLAVAFHGAYDCSVFVKAPLEIEGHALASQAMFALPIAFTILAFFVLRAMARTALRLDDADAARAAAAAVAARAPVMPQTQ